MKNKEAIVEILGLEDDQVSNLESDNKMKDYNFDSLAIVMLQSFIDEEYNIQIDPDNLPSFESINDLDVEQEEIGVLEFPYINDPDQIMIYWKRNFKTLLILLLFLMIGFRSLSMFWENITLFIDNLI